MVTFLVERKDVVHVSELRALSEDELDSGASSSLTTIARLSGYMLRQSTEPNFTHCADGHTALTAIPRPVHQISSELPREGRLRKMIA